MRLPIWAKIERSNAGHLKEITSPFMSLFYGSAFLSDRFEEKRFLSVQPASQREAVNGKRQFNPELF